MPSNAELETYLQQLLATIAALTASASELQAKLRELHQDGRQMTPDEWAAVKARRHAVEDDALAKLRAAAAS